MSDQIRPSEISDILLAQLRKMDTDLHFEEVGTVLQVSDGVIRIYGLMNAGAGELLELGDGMKAVVMNLEEDNVGAVLLGSTEKVKEGMTVKRTGRIASVDVGDEIVGRVVNPLGEPM
ncbi:MAG: F0F1 ATP synthase subunit alpha, partial [Bacteroidales bacterium]|nr:F0F1 ATP synthase subunit alpha [Bacteroidales bacterium]